jgi:hypothetical protein
MFEVIISTISSGRVQRKAFDTWQAANRCFNRFDAARSRSGNRVYRVELEHREPPVVRTFQPAANPATAA